MNGIGQQSGNAPLRVAVIGYGLAGRTFHSRLIASCPDFELAAVVTTNPERCSQLMQDHPTVQALSSTESLFAASEDFDVVVIATLNSSHVPLALAALDLGLHVVVDKPMAATRAEAESVFHHAQAVGKQVHVFQNRRWDSDFLTVSELVSAGEIGTVHRFQSSFERFRPQTTGAWREVGKPTDLPGLLYDLGSHLVDQALQLWGPAERVYASARALRPPHLADDDTLITIEHASGVISELNASVLAASLAPRFRVLGDRGGITVYGLDEQEDTLRREQGPLTQQLGKTSRVAIVHDGQGITAEHQLTRGRWDSFYPSVASAIRGESPGPVDPASAVRTVALLEAAHQSATQRQWVTIAP
jgi:predicted dehydrogenase